MIVCRTAQGWLALLIWTCGATDEPTETKATHRDATGRLTDIFELNQLCADGAELKQRLKRKKIKRVKAVFTAKLSVQSSTPKAERVWTLLWLIWIRLLIHQPNPLS